MLTIQKLAAKINQDAISSLIRNLRAIPADKVDWKPLEAGRSALSQAQECAVITGMTVFTLHNKALPPMEDEAFGKMMAELDSVDKVVAALEKNGKELTAAIESFPDADLEQTVKLPWEETPSSMAEIMMLSYWNNVYHQGQFCYIQTLYGDKEMH